MNWDKTTQEKFRVLLDKIPVFLRAIAEEKVSKRAETIAQKENHPEITEKDLVDAFFAETPFGFHGPMKSDMEELGINYVQYGYEK
ncbi:MAG TPA: PCP reductase family protein [Candidatus Omnitrophota bacterium]|nr:PCP reductase family protein [Candidatus Omnitrophota bacterium]